jgi:ATP-binding protein involved in chromosome partitioning
MSVTKEDVIEKLRTVKGPNFEGDIVSLGLVSEIFIADSKVFFSITVPAARAQELEPLRAAAERAVKAMPGVAGAIVALTAEKKGGGMEAPPPPPRPQATIAPKPPAPARARRRMRRPRRHPASAACRVSRRSSRSPPARAASASRPPRSTWRSASRRSGLKVGAARRRHLWPVHAAPAGLSGRPETVDGQDR